MGFQLDPLRKQSFSGGNALQKTFAESAGSFADRCLAANEVMESVFPIEITQQGGWLNLQPLQYLWLLIRYLAALASYYWTPILQLASYWTPILQLARKNQQRNHPRSKVTGHPHSNKLLDTQSAGQSRW